MTFHVFKKPKKLKNGKTVHRWYYYYLDEDKKQKQRACRKCKTRKEAEDYIRALEGGNSLDKAVLIRDIAANMFIPGSAHVNRLEQLGRVYDMSTLLDARRFIRQIINDWGDRPLASIDPTEVTTYLFGKQRSGQWKNRYKKIFSEMYDEAKWQKLKIPKPAFDSFAVRPKKADVLTTDELKRFFVPENFSLPRMGHDGDVFYTMFLLCLSGGLRLGEVRAVRRKQVFFDRKALIVDGFCKRDGRRTTYNKKGSPENPRLRVTMPSDLALKKLSEYMAAHPAGEDDFIFSESGGKPISQDRAEYVFEQALILAKINTDSRKLVCHSLRYTYVTRMRRELPGETVMKMVGHISLEQTDYYTNRRALDESIAGLMGANAAADNLFT
ncbi:MAG: site-specific integrase [Spirochaetaceae bacterium]|jgi:integrase|nr:site-specific integrase [Spirochaetaceae bacterium]